MFYLGYSKTVNYVLWQRCYLIGWYCSRPLYKESNDLSCCDRHFNVSPYYTVTPDQCNYLWGQLNLISLENSLYVNKTSNAVIYLVMIYLVMIYLVMIYLVMIYLIMIYLIMIYLVMIYLIMIYLIMIYLFKWLICFPFIFIWPDIENCKNVTRQITPSVQYTTL